MPARLDPRLCNIEFLMVAGLRAKHRKAAPVVPTYMPPPQWFEELYHLICTQQGGEAVAASLGLTLEAPHGD